MNPYQFLQIDDNPQDRALVERELRRQFPECAVFRVGNNRDLLRTLKSNSPDLVISGYPHGLKSEQIPLAARMFAIVDVWDALRSDRPYRQAWPEANVREYLREQSGRHFDPAVVEAFFSIVDDEL